VSVGLFGVLVSLSLLSLLAYHVWLLSVSETTNENLRQNFLRNVNPYDRGCCTNWHRLLWADLPPSRLDFLTEEVREGDLPGQGTDVAEVARRARCLPSRFTTYYYASMASRSASSASASANASALATPVQQHNHAIQQQPHQSPLGVHLNTPQGYIPPRVRGSSGSGDDEESRAPDTPGYYQAADAEETDATLNLLPAANGNSSTTRQPPH
jgi:hypothetical protein